MRHTERKPAPRYPLAKQDFTFSVPLRVRWAEVDKQGIVFNGNYLHYFDVGITEYWRALGLNYPDGLLSHGSDLYTKKALVEYHLPARYDDVIEVCARIARIGRSSMQFVFELYRAEELLASGEVVYVNADPASMTPVPVPEFLRSKILDFERVQPARS
jgi:acyl-CoA thioester hydrolase